MKSHSSHRQKLPNLLLGEYSQGILSVVVDMKDGECIEETAKQVYFALSGTFDLKCVCSILRKHWGEKDVNTCITQLETQTELSRLGSLEVLYISEKPIKVGDRNCPINLR